MIAFNTAQQPVGQQQGFTLMEVLVATTLFSLIVLLLSGSFYFADRSREASQAKAGSSEDVRQVYRVLKQYLETVQPVWQLGADGKSISFSGDRHYLKFSSVMPAHLGPAGVYHIHMSVKDRGSGRSLFFSRELLHPEREPQHLVDKPLAILEGKEKISFSYYGAASDRADAQWHKEWRIMHRLPELVKLQLTDSNQAAYEVTVRLYARPTAITPVYEPKLTKVW